MGHYYADMMCDACGELRCVCPPKEDRSTDNHWVVGDRYEVMTAIEYERSRGHGGLAHMQRLYKKHYPKREQAEEAAREACEAAVEAARQHLTDLKNVLKVQRPWEKK